MADLRQSPEPAPLSMNTAGNSVWSLADAKAVSRPLPATRHLIRHLQKIIDELQAQNSQLQKKIKDLEQNLPPSEERSSVTEAEETSLGDEFRHFGRRYRIMVNLFMAGKPCAPSKDTKNYNPSQRFGLHRDEGDFCNVTSAGSLRFIYM